MMRFLIYTIALFLVGCSSASRPAPDFSGAWMPIKQGYTSQVEVFPLMTTHAFKALPIDVNLRALLERWVREGNVALSYPAVGEFSLSREVAQINALDLDDAIHQLAQIYQASNIDIELGVDNVVRVRPFRLDGDAHTAKTERVSTERSWLVDPPKALP